MNPVQKATVLPLQGQSETARAGAMNDCYRVAQGVTHTSASPWIGGPLALGLTVLEAALTGAERERHLPPPDMARYQTCLAERGYEVVR